MSHIIHPLPFLEWSQSEVNVAKRTARKDWGRKTTVPEEVVAGLKWLMDHGFTFQALRTFYPGVPEGYLIAIRSGVIRANVLPKCPPFISEHFWRERYRWPSSSEPEESVSQQPKESE